MDISMDNGSCAQLWSRYFYCIEAKIFRFGLDDPEEKQ
jgi:hypothetical protein